MDNASQALVIAASVMLGVILFAALLTMRDKVGDLKAADNMNELIEQNKEYNAQYEAYNKSFMYGTDIISVVSKAYNNNLKQNDENTEYAEDQYVSIEINLGSEPLKYRYYYYFIIDGEEVRKSPNDGNQTQDKSDQIEGSSTLKLTNGTQFLVNDKEQKTADGKNIMQELLNVSSGPVKQRWTDAKYNGIYSKYRLRYSYVTDFKRRAFACTDVEYSASSGKISKMVFNELDLSNYDEFSTGYKNN